MLLLLNPAVLLPKEYEGVNISYESYGVRVNSDPGSRLGSLFEQLLAVLAWGEMPFQVIGHVTRVGRLVLEWAGTGDELVRSP